MESFLDRSNNIQKYSLQGVNTTTYIYFNPSSRNKKLPIFKQLIESRDDKLVFQNKHDPNDTYHNLIMYIDRLITVDEVLCNGLEPEDIQNYALNTADIVLVISGNGQLMPNGNIYGFSLLQIHKHSNSVYAGFICSNNKVRYGGDNIMRSIEFICNILYIQKITLQSVQSAISFYERYGFNIIGSCTDKHIVCDMEKNMGIKIRFKKGSKVIYTKQETKPVVTIDEIHIDKLSPNGYIYYTIQLQNGTKIKTTDIYLKENTSFTGQNVAPKQTTSIVEFTQGSKVLYKNNSMTTPETVTIIAVHRDNLPELYYTIQLSDGREKQTPHIYLKNIQPQTQLRTPTENIRTPTENIQTNKFEKGSLVLYKKNKDDASEMATILDVHLDDLPEIYYTIQLQNEETSKINEVLLYPPEVIYWKDSKKIHTTVTRFEKEENKYVIIDRDTGHSISENEFTTGLEIKTGRENLLFIPDRISEIVGRKDQPNHYPSQNQIDAISHCAKLRNMKLGDRPFGCTPGCHVHDSLFSQYHAVSIAYTKIPPNKRPDQRISRRTNINRNTIFIHATSRIRRSVSRYHRVSNTEADFPNDETYQKNPEDSYTSLYDDPRWVNFLENPRIGSGWIDGWPGAATLYACANELGCVINVLTDYGTKNNVISIIPAKLSGKNSYEENISRKHSYEDSEDVNWRNEWSGPYSGGGATGSKPQKPPEDPRPFWNEIWIAYIDRHIYAPLELIQPTEIKGGRRKIKYIRSRKITKKTHKQNKTRKQNKKNKKNKKKRNKYNQSKTTNRKITRKKHY